MTKAVNVSDFVSGAKMLIWRAIVGPESTKSTPKVPIRDHVTETESAIIVLKKFTYGFSVYLNKFLNSEN
jgi:hypothetical protein